MDDVVARRLLDRQVQANEADVAAEEFITQLADALEIPEVRQMIAGAVADTWKQDARKKGGGRRG
jgi:hypothetical protein